MGDDRGTIFWPGDDLSPQSREPSLRNQQWKSLLMNTFHLHAKTHFASDSHGVQGVAGSNPAVPISTSTVCQI